ncbi:MAG TPA: baseplate J/gp47 family protein [Candidatus Andersenbacteria bacterium]|nr:baseplate J/gp47 family protein [Candidatus Andersenbacteria bacterium]
MAVRFQFPQRSISLILIVLIIGIVGVVLMSRLPNATITIHPKIVQRKVSKDIILSSKATTPDYIHYVLPANIITQEGHAQQTFTQPAGQVTQGNSKGTVTFTNSQDTEQRLLPKTHLKYEQTGVMFLTDNPVIIPPNGTVDATVTAEQQGTSGDVAPGKFLIDKFSPGLQKVVYAESKSPFSGGEVGSAAIAQQDIDTAKQTVLDAAKQQALDAIKKAANGADVRSDLLSVNTENNDASVQAGSKAVSYTASAAVQAREFIVDSHDIISLMTLALRADVAPDEEFISYDPASFSLTISQTDWNTGQARIAASLTGTYGKKIGSEELSEDNLFGLSKQELISHFSSFPTIGTIDIHFWPFWVTSTPSRPNQINIEVAH